MSENKKPQATQGSEQNEFITKTGVKADVIIDSSKLQQFYHLAALQHRG